MPIESCVETMNDDYKKLRKSNVSRWFKGDDTNLEFIDFTFSESSGKVSEHVDVSNSLGSSLLMMLLSCVIPSIYLVLCEEGICKY